MHQALTIVILVIIIPLRWILWPLHSLYQVLIQYQESLKPQESHSADPELSKEVKYDTAEVIWFKGELARTQEELKRAKEGLADLLKTRARELAGVGSVSEVKESPEKVTEYDSPSRQPSLKQEFDQLQEKHVGLEQEKEAAVPRVRDELSEERQKLQSSMERERALTFELERLWKNYNKLRETAEIRAAELRDAQAYQSMVDITAPGDINRMAMRINAEIDQVAAQVADELERSDRPRIQGTLDEGAAKIVEPLIGKKMIDLLVREQDILLVQIALQACIVNLMSTIITNWGSGLPGPCDTVLMGTYNYIQQSESQAVSAKWRVLTRKNLRKLTGDQDISPLESYLIPSITAVLLVAGFSEIPQDQWHPYKQKLLTICHLSCDLRRAIGEDLISADILIVIPCGEEIFMDDSMEDAYADKDNVSQDNSANYSRILCTVEFGLKRLEKHLAGAQDIKDEAGQSFKTIMKPRVVLESLAAELSEAARENMPGDAGLVDHLSGVD